MASEEVQFLRDQVQRLNTTLSQYQEKYPPIGRPQAESGQDGAPWVVDKNLLTPLMAEYDANIQMMKEQVEMYKSEQKELRTQVSRLVAENKRLTRELKGAVQSQLDRFDIEDLEPAVEEDQLLQNLQQQLQMALQEKESALEMWQASTQEVDRLEQDLKNSQLNPRLRSIETQADQLKNQYAQAMSEMSNQMVILQEELKKSKNEHKAALIQVADLRRTLEEMKNQLLRKEQEKTMVNSRNKATDNKLEEASGAVIDLQSRIDEGKREISRLTNEKKTLEQKVIELQKKSAEFEQREYEAVIQVRESVQMVESAMLEKDQALVRERQATEEVSRLQEAIAKLLDEAGARTRQEVDNVKKQCNQNISRLMEEIHALELDNSEKQAQLDRAIREKRAVESELEKIYQEGMVQGSKEALAYDDLNRRTCNAERARDEALVKLDSTLNQLKRTEMSARQEKKHLESDLQSLRERFDTMSQEFEKANEDRVKLFEEIDELKKKIQKVQGERDASQRNFTKQMTCMESDLKMKSEEYEVKLQSLEDTHRHSMLEMRNLLTAQQRMSAKWKEECQTITQKFEIKVTDLRSEVSRHKKRNDELTKLLKESKNKTIEAEQMLVEYSRNIKRMEDRIREAENRANSASLQISKQLSRARNLMHSTGGQTTGMSNSLRSTADPLNLSDLAVNGGLQTPHVHFSGSTHGEDGNT